MENIIAISIIHVLLHRVQHIADAARIFEVAEMNPTRVRRDLRFVI